MKINTTFLSFKKKYLNKDQIARDERLLKNYYLNISNNDINGSIPDSMINLTELKELNIDVISDRPTVGAEGYKVVFIHPKSTGGVLVELAQKNN